jgi:hypothetical protein
LLCSSYLALGVPNCLAIIIIINYTPAISAAPPSSPIKGGHSSLSLAHLVLPIPYLVAPPWLLLKQSASKIINTYTWRSEGGGGVSGGSLLPLPHWTEGVEDVGEPYV